MGVITGITTGIRIAKRIESRYRYLDPSNKFIRKFVPPAYRTRTRQIKDILITGGVIYDAAIELHRAFQKKPKYASNKYNQTRNQFEQFGSQSKRRYKYRRDYCRRTPRRKY